MWRPFRRKKAELKTLTQKDIKMAPKRFPGYASLTAFVNKNDRFDINAKIPIQMRVETYASPVGPGWILRCEFYKDGLGPDNYGNNGNHWVYQHNQGPDAIQGIWDEWYIEPEGGI